MTSERIWIVEGSTGEYSDHCYWQVCAFSDENKAKEFVGELNNFCIEHGCDANRGDYGDLSYTERENFCPLDPGFRCDYTGTNYYCFSLELRD